MQISIARLVSSNYSKSSVNDAVLIRRNSGFKPLEAGGEPDWEHIYSDVSIEINYIINHIWQNRNDFFKDINELSYQFKYDRFYIYTETYKFPSLDIRNPFLSRIFITVRPSETTGIIFDSKSDLHGPQPFGVQIKSQNQYPTISQRNNDIVPLAQFACGRLGGNDSCKIYLGSYDNSCTIFCHKSDKYLSYENIII